jgi:putative tryptophan/tyrosine transport system substrate-binding protein
MNRPASRKPRVVMPGPEIERRTFIALVSSGILAAPFGAAAQPAGKVARIGYLSSSTAAVGAGLLKAFTDGLNEHGWTEGKNIAVEFRWEGPGKTLDSNGAELARLPLDVIVAVNTPAALAMKRTGTTLPVVFATVSEPIVTGLVRSLARPGSNFTGLTTINRELMPKRLEVLKQAIPGLARIGYLANPDYAVHKVQLEEMTATARGLGLTLHLAEARAPSELEGAFARMAAARGGALIVQQDELFRDHRAAIVELARRQRLADMYVFSIFPRAGGLMSYGANAEDLYRRAAGHVDRILKGAKPSELPVERPSKFELVINLKTAKALGLTIPKPLLLQADQVIE